MSHESIPFILYAISAMFIAALGALHWGEQHESKRFQHNGSGEASSSPDRVKE